METVDWALVLQWSAWTIIVLGAIAYLLTRMHSSARDELEGLVHTRGEMIDDLREHVADLESRLSAAEGEIVALRKQQTDIIIDGVNMGIRDLVIELKEA